MLNINDLQLFNKIVFLRVDFNVPIKNKTILSDKRIISVLPTIKKLMFKGAKLILASHLGRPKEGIYDENYSLLPIAQKLENILKYKVRLVSDYLYNNIVIDNNEIIMLENVRFNIGETSNNDKLSKRYSELCDIFIMDAFATSHRKHSSTYGICKFVNLSCLGLLFLSEIKCLSKIIYKPKRPMVSIIGGAKISTKLNFLNSLAKISDTLILGGGISNTFIATKFNVGKSLYEPNFLNIARKMLKKYNIPFPLDCRVGKNFSEKALSWNKELFDINNNEEIMDLGDKTLKLISNIILKSKTILWNGPVGVFEFINFRKGTEIISKSIINSKAFSVVGGGDTIAAIELFKIENKISYISTGGGAFLKFIENKKLPILKLLTK